MTRPSEITRERILKAAERLFADRGYDATSVRAIVAKARVNQAAINYHFAGKDGLYREVLRAAFRALTEHQLAHAQETKACRASRRWANSCATVASASDARRTQPAHPHSQLGSGASDRGVPQARERGSGAVHGLAVDLVRRFMPDADQHSVVVAAIWLIGQCSVFVRNREQLGQSRRSRWRSTRPPSSGLPNWSPAGRWPGFGTRTKPGPPQEIPGVATKIPCSRPAAAYNRCLKFNRLV